MPAHNVPGPSTVGPGSLPAHSLLQQYNQPGAATTALSRHTWLEFTLDTNSVSPEFFHAPSIILPQTPRCPIVLAGHSALQTAADTAPVAARGVILSSAN